MPYFQISKGGLMGRLYTCLLKMALVVPMIVTPVSVAYSQGVPGARGPSSQDDYRAIGRALGTYLASHYHGRKVVSAHVGCPTEEICAEEKAHGVSPEIGTNRAVLLSELLASTGAKASPTRPILTCNKPGEVQTIDNCRMRDADMTFTLSSPVVLGGLICVSVGIARNMDASFGNRIASEQRQACFTSDSKGKLSLTSFRLTSIS
jgi:hypothetical protein